MRAVLTRVRSASVTIDGEVTGKIGQGFLILLGVGPEDTEAHCRYLAEKALGSFFMDYGMLPRAKEAHIHLDDVEIRRSGK